MDSELRRVANEYKELLQGRQRLRNSPADFKARVVALMCLHSNSAISRAVGLNTSTLLRWSREMTNSSPSLPASISVTRLPAPAAPEDGGSRFHIEVLTVRGESVRVPFHRDALERVLAFVLERGG